MSHYEVWQEGPESQPRYRVVWAGKDVAGRQLASKAEAARYIFDHCAGRWRNLTVIDRSDHGPPLDKFFLEIEERQGT